MTPQLDTVLRISALGTTLLFGALLGLIGLMYLLTAPWLFRRAVTPPVPEEPPVAEPVDTGAEEEAEERDRQHRAVALAVAVACASSRRSAVGVAEASSGWRWLHHGRRLSQPRARARVRT